MCKLHNIKLHNTYTSGNIIMVLKARSIKWTNFGEHTEREKYHSSWKIPAGIAQLTQRLATGWTVRGSNPSGSEIFRTRPDPSWGPPSLLYNGYRVSFPAIKRPGRGVNHTPPSNAEVKERVELYLYSPCGPSWPVLGQTSPFIEKYK